MSLHCNNNNDDTPSLPLYNMSFKMVDCVCIYTGHHHHHLPLWRLPCVLDSLIRSEYKERRKEIETGRHSPPIYSFIHSFTHSPFTVYTRPVINCLLTSEQVMACYCQLVCSPEYNNSCESVELQDKETLRLGREGAANCLQHVSACIICLLFIFFNLFFSK